MKRNLLDIDDGYFLKIGDEDCINFTKEVRIQMPLNFHKIIEQECNIKGLSYSSFYKMLIYDGFIFDKKSKDIEIRIRNEIKYQLDNLVKEG